jgi:CubicO group peptidase (beta-lactamase class C family)
MALLFEFLSSHRLPAQQDNSTDTARHIARVQSGLAPAIVGQQQGLPVGPYTHTLAEGMAKLNVHGVSIAVLHNGKLEWARGFGVVRLGGPAVIADTMFQAGSISKPVAAFAALKLVDQRKLTLDTDVNQTLTTWKLPDGAAAKGKFVTLRELLTHTGGTTVHGFPGYAAGETVPTLVQILNGEKPANTPAIRIEAEPATRWNYSGGGFTIMQQMVLDVTHQAFPKVLRDFVLGPLGMTRSTYEQPLPEEFSPPVAVPYDDSGTPIPGGAHTYPEMAAAGLWTTPTDLTRYMVEVRASLLGKSNKVLSQEMTQQMLTRGMGNWGLGVQIGGAPDNEYFAHGGVNAGFESLFVMYEKSGDGAVVMTNAQGGTRLAEEIMRSIATEYGWPDWKPVIKTAIKVDPAIFTGYVGSYDLAPGFALRISIDDGHLTVQPTGQPKQRLFAASPTRFFSSENPSEIEFEKDASGKVSGIILHQGGRDMKAPRQ